MLAHPRLAEFKVFLYDEVGEQRPLLEDDCEAFERWISRATIRRTASSEERMDEAPRPLRARARPPEPPTRTLHKLRPPTVTPESHDLSPDAMRMLEQLGR